MRIFLVKKRTLITAAAIIVCVILAVILVIALSKDRQKPTFSIDAVEEYELSVMAGRQRELPVYSVQRDDKKIALTIDAAWEDDKTPFILEELDRQDVKATFYLCGFWAKKYPDNVKAIHAAGHELGNHSMTHPHMNSLSKKQIQKELIDFDDLLEKLIGKRSATFRAPYGEYNDTVITATRELGYTPVQWSIDTIDWRAERSAETILNSVISKLEPGCIILCHNNGYQIKEYLPGLISAAKEQGYEFVPVSELLLDGNTMIDVNGVQKPA
ncbi:MAG: Peptidoglycan-N-acetylglucosamine deacetylase [Firmicutes bacterium ADurb.Bin182]|nr:MAG: Peptidoglycan-N-acetylglucosamine deacetylase [Firmicutes bacterium ADurb.Bin182]